MLAYVPVEEAVDLAGLRLVLTPGVPGPWSEAAKAILHVKGIAYTAVAQRLGRPDPALKAWTGQESAPAAMFEGERPRTRWDEILFLAERLAPEPRLIPRDEAERVMMFGLSHAICGEDGLGWNCRLWLFETQSAVARNVSGGGPTADPLAVLQARYGDPARGGAEALDRLRSVLALLAGRLRAQDAIGSPWLVGRHPTAADLYWLAFSNLVSPMAAAACPMPDGYRRMGEALAGALGEAIDPLLIAHRDRVFGEMLVRPLAF